MKIYIGTDHAGFELKNKLKIFLGTLNSSGYEVVDMGADSYNEVDDYPDFIRPVAEAVVTDELSIEAPVKSFGIILGGSGNGEAMCANRLDGARAAVYHGGNLDIVKFARAHNNANILSLGARYVSEEEAMYAVRIFIDTAFTGEARHIRRLNKF